MPGERLLGILYVLEPVVSCGSMSHPSAIQTNDKDFIWALGSWGDTGNQGKRDSPLCADLSQRFSLEQSFACSAAPLTDHASLSRTPFTGHELAEYMRFCHSVQDYHEACGSRAHGLSWGWSSEVLWVALLAKSCRYDGSGVTAKTLT